MEPSKRKLQIYEDYIILLLKNSLIRGYVAKKEEIKNCFLTEFKPNCKTKISFSKILFDLWRYWYVRNVSKTFIYFDQRWMNHLSHLERAKYAFRERKVNEKGICDSNGCQLCLVKLSDNTLIESHRESLEHQIRLQYLKNKDSFKQSEEISLTIIELNNTSNSESLKMEFEQKTNVNATLHLRNKCQSEVTIIEIIQINLLVTDLMMSIKYEKEMILKPDEHIVIVFNGYFENSASFTFPIVVAAKCPNKENVDHFLKEIAIKATSEFSDLKSDFPYTKPKRYAEIESCDVVIPGARPKQYKSFYKEQFRLEPYEIPAEFEEKLRNLQERYPSFLNRESPYDVNKILYGKILEVLGISPEINENNYCDTLMALVYLEENQLKFDIREYDTIATLTPKGGKCYELKVPGLAECRPSLLVNDSVYVKEYRNDFRKYQGIVHEVLESSVILGFSTKFSAVFLPNKQFHIEFGYSKRPLRVEKQAIRLTREHNVVSYFFPKIEPQQIESLSIKTISFFNTILNTEQRRAVRNILETKEVPYLIFGPPGTGKTVTIVEAILQIWKNQPTARILVCAPSNTATNEIALRLVNKIPSTDILRLLGNIYGKDARLRELENIINVNKDDKLPYIPSLEDILKYRVVLTTLVTAARIVNGGVPAGHYTHVFIDESGYATESQTLIAMAGILSNSKHKGNVKGQIVLAGDPRQLGPVVHSNFAKDCGYGTSMLERLINRCKIYARNYERGIPYNEMYITKLVKNYRSHHTILKIPNELFYYNELIPVGNELSNLFTEWEYLKMPNFPLIFHHVQGEDKRESDSPSFFNIQEIEEVIGYLAKLIGTRVRGMEINQDHIGVITPYRKQVEMLRKACKRKQLDNVLIGSVEQFQGKEKLIIIVSTVRSKNLNKFEDIDKKCELGFLRNPKRFNVAITRSKALLIVVGNALVLKNDKNWLTFIQYCVDNGSVAGRAFNLTDNEYLNQEKPPDTSSG